MWMLMFSINLALTSLIKHIWSWTKSKAFFSHIFQFAVNKQHSVYWLFVFKTGHSGAYELYSYHMEITKKKNQSIASHSGIYLKLNISMVNTKIQKWKNSSLSHKVQYAFTFSLQSETLYSHSVEERNPHITHLPKLLAKITSTKYL